MNRNHEYDRLKRTKKIIGNQILPNKPKKLISTVKIERPHKIKIHRPFKSIFLSGGIGDVIAIESFLSDQERQSIQTILYATNKRIFIEELFKSLTSFPKLENHISLWDDFSDFWCFWSLEDYISKTKEKHTQLNSKLQDCKDLSILRFFQEIKKGNANYNESSFLKEKVANISHLNLPHDYLVIVPYSTDKRIKERDFNKHDWDEILVNLKNHDLYGLVINSEKEMVPKNKLIIDMSQKTKILESIEILKGAKGYFGIDSWISVLAAKLFDVPNLQIKSRNVHCYDNAKFYYAPKTSFEFLVKNITASH